MASRLPTVSVAPVSTTANPKRELSEDASPPPEDAAKTMRCTADKDKVIGGGSKSVSSNMKTSSVTVAKQMGLDLDADEVEDIELWPLLGQLLKSWERFPHIKHPEYPGLPTGDPLPLPPTDWTAKTWELEGLAMEPFDFPFEEPLMEFPFKPW